MIGIHLKRADITGAEYCELRRELGLTQKQLAERLQMSPMSIAHREQGVRQPTYIEVELMRVWLQKDGIV